MTVKKVNKNTSVNTEVVEVKDNVKEETTMSNNNLINQFNEERTYTVGEERVFSFAIHDNVGMTLAKILEIQQIITKKEGNPDLGIDPEFHMALKVTFEVDGEVQPETYIKDYITVKEDGTRLPIKPIFADYDSKTGKGERAWFKVPKKAALTKPVEDLTASDMDTYRRAPNQTIWSALNDEYKAIRTQLGLADVTFINGKADIPQVTMPVYVYEDLIVKEITKTKFVEGKTVTETTREAKPYQFFSFVSPAEKTKDGQPIYGEYFARKIDENGKQTDDIPYLKKCLELPGVQRYINSLGK